MDQSTKDAIVILSESYRMVTADMGLNPMPCLSARRKLVHAVRWLTSEERADQLEMTNAQKTVRNQRYA